MLRTSCLTADLLDSWQRNGEEIIGGSPIEAAQNERLACDVCTTPARNPAEAFVQTDRVIHVNEPQTHVTVEAITKAPGYEQLNADAALQKRALRLRAALAIQKAHASVRRCSNITRTRLGSIPRLTVIPDRKVSLRNGCISTPPSSRRTLATMGVWAFFPRSITTAVSPFASSTKVPGGYSPTTLSNVAPVLSGCPPAPRQASRAAIAGVMDARDPRLLSFAV